MADEVKSNILSWTVENWITVVLMAAIGFGIFAAAQSWYTNKQG